MQSIKTAGLSDLHIIHDLAHQIWPVSYKDILSPEQLEYMLEQVYSIASLQHQLVSLKHNFILVTDEDIPAGFASYSPKDISGITYRLHKIYVLPQQQGRGTGKFLLEHAIQTIRSSGAAFLELNVNRHNRAKVFYEKQGFFTCGEEDIDIGNGFYMNDYIMRLIL